VAPTYLASRDRSVLVVVDIQGRLLPAIANHEQVVANTTRLIEGAKLLDVPCLLTEQYPRGLGPSVASLRGPLAGLVAIEKLSFSCAGAPAFLEALRATGRRQAVLCGIETHICVLQTAMDLARAEFHVFVAADAVGSRSPENREVALARMRAAGITVTCTESVLFEWLRVAGTEVFKQVTRLVR